MAQHFLVHYQWLTATPMDMVLSMTYHNTPKGLGKLLVGRNACWKPSQQYLLASSVLGSQVFGSISSISFSTGNSYSNGHNDEYTL